MHAVAPWTTCANLQQNRFIVFQKNVFSSSVKEERTTDGRTDGQTDRLRT